LGIFFAIFGIRYLKIGIIFPWHRLSTITTLPIPWIDFHAPLNLDDQANSKFENIVCHNLAALTIDHKNEWESAKLIDHYFLVGVTAIPYLLFGKLIIIVFKEDISYHVTLGDIMHYTCHLNLYGKKGNRCIANIFIICLDFVHDGF
jgi:hypothetical protein